MGEGCLLLLEGIKESVHAFLQQGDDVRMQDVQHPLPVRDTGMYMTLDAEGRKGWIQRVLFAPFVCHQT